MFNGCLRAFERDSNLDDAGQSFENCFDTTDTAHTGHAFDWDNGCRDGIPHVFMLHDFCEVLGVCQCSAFQRLSNSEFVTTETELMAIAAPAMTGLSIPNAASGIPSVL